jgi:hypothetical protein
MYNAVLCQIQRPREFDESKLRRQLELFALSYPYILRPFVDHILLDELSYEGWVRGIGSKQVWGNETVLIAISLMWNVSISIMTPTSVFPVYHNEKVPDIVIMANGEKGDMTHFSGTGRLMFL